MRSLLVILCSAALWSASLSSADLWRASLSSADLWNASLSGADLWSASLSGERSPRSTESLALPGTESLALPGTESLALPGTESLALPGTESLALPGTESLAFQGTESLALSGNESLAPRENAAPAISHVRLDTTKGPIVIEVHRDWAPHGADRFYELVTAGYFDDNRFFRVVKGQWAQFGINGDPAVSKRWRTQTIPDDPRKQSNVRGMVAFAFAEPNARTTQVYIALKDLSDPQDAQGFAPFGRVAEGMDVADALNSEYGESSGSGIRAGKQQPLFDGGNAYLDREFPRLDRLLHAVVMR